MRIIQILSVFFVSAAIACTLSVQAAPLKKNKPVAAKQVKKTVGAQKKSFAKPAAASRVVIGKKGSALQSRGLQGKKLLRGKRGVIRAAYEPPSLGRMTGLHDVRDELDLKSGVALVIDQDTHEVLFSKNDSTILPIASITKLMTGIVISEANLPMNEVITLTQDDVVGERGVRSRLQVGMELTRGELMHLALMSSENRAAQALGRTYPAGLQAFVAMMNAKAKSLGMNNTRYVEPTGLSSDNRSTAQDLALLVAAASHNTMVSQYTTSHGYQLAAGHKTLQYVNTNRLTANPSWEIGVQKTGYIASAGRCLVMQTKVAGRKLVMVFLDSMGKYSRLGDAERVRAWLEGRSGRGPHA